MLTRTSGLARRSVARFIAALAAVALLAACSSSQNSQTGSSTSEVAGSTTGAAPATTSQGSSAPAGQQSSAAGPSAGPSAAGPSAGSSAGPGPGEVDPAAAALVPDAVKKAGAVKVASAFGYPPEQFYAADGKTQIGFSVELGHALGQKLGVPFEFENVNFGGILVGIAAHRYDAAITSMSVTPDRSKQVNFVTYLNAGGSVLVSAKNPKNIQGLEDLCGAKVTNVVGSLYGQFLTDYSAKNCQPKGKAAIELVNFDDAASPNQAVIAGRVDAAFRDFTANAYVAQQSNGALKVVGGVVASSPYGVAVSKDRPDLAKAITVAMNDLIQDGEYVAILKKWNVAEAALTKSELILATG